MVVADLHVHTTNSDGELALDAVPGAARRADVDTVAITDHDRLNPDLDAPVVDRGGVTLVHGIELRVQAADQRIDLLGYGAARTPGLTREMDRLQRDRIERTRAIAECVEDRLGVSLDVPFEPGVGRPHVARAVDASAADYDYADAFAELICDDGPCYVAREIPTFERGRRLLTDACGLVGLAHPLRYDDPTAALSLAAGLDAVERYYPYDRAVDRAPVDRAIEAHGCLPTGGSDAHDDRLGRAGLDRGDADRFHERLDERPSR